MKNEVVLIHLSTQSLSTNQAVAKNIGVKL